MQQIHSILSTDEDLRELVVLFVSEMPDRIAKFESEFEASNWAELQRTTHQLKGAAGSYGFMEISPAAAELEELLKNNASLDKIQQKLHDLLALCRCATSDPPE